MTDEQKKEMLLGIINNGESWECRCDKSKCTCSDCDWKPYKLGDEIHEDWEYRKAETWLEERKSCLSVSFDKKNINCFEAGIKETCKKILEEVAKENNLCSASHYLKQIIKGLGIEV